MSCGFINRRFSRGRKFLYEEEIQKLIEGGEKLKRKTISTLEVDDNYRSRLVKTTNLNETLSKLQQFGSGICRIEVAQENGPNYTGTGFHFGDGWILTAAHVLRNRDKVNMARFVFFPPGTEISFEARPRRAIVHRLLPAGRRPDYHNRDIVLVKLGFQYTYGRKKDDLEEWEIDEQQLLEQSDLFNFTSLLEKTFTPTGDEQFSLKSTDPLTIIHFGSGQNDRKKFAYDIETYEVYKHMDLKVINFAFSFDSGASGCPVIQRVGEKWILVGVFFGGAYYENEANSIITGQALVWNQKVVQHIEAGREAVDKMSSFKQYNVFIPFSERAQLVLETKVKEAADLAVKHRILIL